MATQRQDTPGIGFQVYLEEGGEEVGAVREVHREYMLIYIENAGDFRIGPDGIRRVHDGKVILDANGLTDEVRTAIRHAHDEESL
jgi:hypothetical protein